MYILYIYIYCIYIYIYIHIYIYNYSIKFTPTESHAGGTLLYINNKLSCKCGQNLCIFKSS